MPSNDSPLPDGAATYHSYRIRAMYPNGEKYLSLVTLGSIDQLVAELPDPRVSSVAVSIDWLGSWSALPGPGRVPMARYRVGGVAPTAVDPSWLAVEVAKAASGMAYAR